MYRYISLILVTLFAFTPFSAFADCRGCCSGHGGTDCINGITKCVDGSEMSPNCKAKCNKCTTGAMKKDAAGGNQWNDSFSGAKKILEKQVYSNQRLTFYCGCPFDGQKMIQPCADYTPKKEGTRAKRVEWEHIAPAAHFGQSFKEWREGHPDCVDKKGKAFKGRSCASKVSVPYRYMESDLYNLVPAIGEVNGLRSNFRFDMITGETRDFGSCDMEIDSKARIAEPPQKVRGDIARTYKYMDESYPGHGIIAGASKKLFDAWDKLDPVDAWECQRCKRIEEIQGNENLVVKKACQKAGLW